MGSQWPTVYIIGFVLAWEIWTSDSSEEFSLNGNDWLLSDDVGNLTVKAEVPGSVYTDLMRTGIIGDPYYRFNDVAYRWISYTDWKYEKSFQVEELMMRHKHVQLVFSGVDTVALVTLNDVVIAHLDNKFRSYTVDVSRILKVGVNMLSILLKSPVAYARERARAYPYKVPPACPPPEQKGECFFNFIRKEACSFSWDWGPAFPTMGIWKNISLLAFDAAAITYITAETASINANQWLLKVDVFFDVASSVDGYVELNISELALSHRMKVSLKLNSSRVSISVPVFKVKPWWPSGYGEATLYSMSVLFAGNNGDFDVRVVKVGFRTVELVQDSVPGSMSGTTFYFRVNGIPVFAKGSNWIPADSFQERITVSYLEQLLHSASEANMNMLRVCGVGVYESEDFYRLTDELGIMIWQDFMFACALYPTNDSFIENVKKEVIHQVRRLKHHPSIVIWSGNNENEEALANNWFNIKKADFPLYKADYIKLYITTVRSAVLDEDTSRPFVASGPSNGLDTAAEGWIAKDPQSPYFGDIHDYNYLRNSWNASQYVVPRFASEFGLQSWCSLETLAPVSKPAVDWDMTSGFVKHRQHHPNGEAQMLLELEMNLKPPNSTNVTRRFADFIYLTQINQAVGIKTEVEKYRRSQSRIHQGLGLTMGALYWQLNDIWQAPTWSSLEFGGKWKMLHYFSKRFFSKVSLSAYIEADILSVYYINDGASNQTLFHFASTNDRTIHSVNVASAENGELKFGKDIVTVEIKCFSWTSFIPLMVWNITFHKPEIGAKQVFVVPLTTILAKCHCLTAADCFLYFTDLSTGAPDVYLLLANLSDARIKPATIKIADVRQLDATTAEIHLVSSAVALFVWLDCPGFSGRFSDNGFLLVQSEIIVKFYAWKKFDDFNNFVHSLTVRSLSDVYLT